MCVCVFLFYGCTHILTLLVSSVCVLQKNTKAPQAAGKIHTDFEKGFIMAEVCYYQTCGYISTAQYVCV